VEATWRFLEDVQGAPLERLEEPTNHRLFSWGPCSWTVDPNCEEAIFDGLVEIPEKGGIYPVVHDDGKDVRVAITFNKVSIAMVANQDGIILEAFRYQKKEYYASALYIHGNKYALPLRNYNNPTPWGVLGEIGGKDPLIFKPEFPIPQLGAGPQGYAMTSTRWAWWVAQVAMISFDVTTGNPPSIFSQTYYSEEAPQGEVRVIDSPINAGNYFLSSENRIFKNRLKSAIVLSDGVSKGKDMLPWTDEAADDGTPIFADSHLAWFRAYGYKELNLYEHTELWSSPFSEDPSQIKPVKIMDLDSFNVTFPTYMRNGGWGRVLIFQGFQTEADGKHKPILLKLVDLVNKTSPLTIELPTTLWSQLISGLTRTHAWFAVDQPGYYPPRKLIRWKLPPGGSAPPTP
jgi:hypothetical protein